MNGNIFFWTDWRCILFFGVLCATTVAAADTHPFFPHSDSRLDQVIVEVNGAPRLVRQGGELVAVLGDTLKIRSALLRGEPAAPEAINFVGFRSALSTNPLNDAGIVINSAVDVKRGWSLRKEGKVYKVEASSGQTFHGLITVRFVEPELSYVVVEVNGNSVVVRKGDELPVRKTDQIKVKQIVTNLSQLDDEVTYRLDPDSGAAKDGRALYRISFLRQGRTFAEIPIRVR